MKNPLLCNSYYYYLPKELIAKEPATPRDSSRLLVYDRKKDKVIHTFFSNIQDFLPKNSVLILNDAKVFKARLYGNKNTGGKVEVLINSILPDNIFLVFIKGKVKIGTKIFFDEHFYCEVCQLNIDGSREVKFFESSNKLLNFEELLYFLERFGHIPLPPYIDRKDNLNDISDYQSVFANKETAVAAPTASLHFTKELFENITKNHKFGFLTLHVGAGTFKPVESENILEHKIHTEYYEITANAQNLIDNKENKIVAVGTTAARTIEHYVRCGNTFGNADIFIHPLNKPQRIDHLITNFHLPCSTLLMLVSSFIGLEKCIEIYEEAIEKKYRFYSYGDAMLIV